jgi:hypothetical protein
MKKSKRQKPAPPLFLTQEIVDAYENGTKEEFIALYQPAMRYVCTRIGAWRDCCLPRCRRSRTCTGSNKLSTFHRNFPPCICSNERHQAWLAEHHAYVEEMEAAYPDSGGEQGV